MVYSYHRVCTASHPLLYAECSCPRWSDHSRWQTVFEKTEWSTHSCPRHRRRRQPTCKLAESRSVVSTFSLPLLGRLHPKIDPIARAWKHSERVKIENLSDKKPQCVGPHLRRENYTKFALICEFTRANWDCIGGHWHSVSTCEISRSKWLT